MSRSSRAYNSLNKRMKYWVIVNGEPRSRHKTLATAKSKAHKIGSNNRVRIGKLKKVRTTYVSGTRGKYTRLEYGGRPKTIYKRKRK